MVITNLFQDYDVACLSMLEGGLPLQTEGHGYRQIRLLGLVLFEGTVSSLVLGSIVRARISIYKKEIASNNDEVLS